MGDAKNPKQVNFIGRAQLSPVVPLPDGLGESGLLVALGNMLRSKTAPLLEEIERPGVEVSLDNFDFLVPQLVPPTPTRRTCSPLQRVLPSYIPASRWFLRTRKRHPFWRMSCLRVWSLLCK